MQSKSKRQRFETLFSRGMRLVYPLIAFTAVMVAPTIRANTVLTNSFASASPGTLSQVALTAADLAATHPIVVTLKLRSLAELQARVGAGEAISSSELAAKYLPLDSDYQAVSDWLLSQGRSYAP